MKDLIERTKSAMVGLGTGWVLILMLVLSVISLAIMLERTWFYFSIREDAEALMRDLGRLLRAGDWDGAKARLAGSKGAEAAVVLAGIEEADRGADAAEEAMNGASALQKLKLERRLAFLGTLGNNAPFIGLLGTVIGIVGAFDELGKATNAGAGTPGNPMSQQAGVMANIAEALVATAIGLVVAIPAVAAFNTFQRVVKATLANTDALGHILLANLKALPVTAGGGTPKESKGGKSPKGSKSKAEPSEEESN